MAACTSSVPGITKRATLFGELLEEDAEDKWQVLDDLVLEDLGDEREELVLIAAGGVLDEGVVFGEVFEQLPELFPVVHLVDDEALHLAFGHFGAARITCYFESLLLQLAHYREDLAPEYCLVVDLRVSLRHRI